MDEVVLGRVVGVFGFKGEVRLHLDNPDDSVLFEPREVTLIGPGGERRTARLVARPGAGRRVLGRIDGVTDEDAAAALRGWQVAIGREALPAPAEGEFYVRDVVGLRVETASGRAVGRVTDVVPGARDVWVIETTEGEAWLVASPENVVAVDVPGGRVVVAEDAVSAG